MTRARRRLVVRRPFVLSFSTPLILDQGVFLRSADPKDFFEAKFFLETPVVMMGRIF
jgi:hypothetical protein